MNQKGFTNVILATVIIVLVGAAGYLSLVKRSAIPAGMQQPESTTSDNVAVTRICSQESKSSVVSKCGSYYSVYSGRAESTETCAPGQGCSVDGPFEVDAGTKIYDAQGVLLNIICGGYQGYASDSARLTQERVCANYLKNCAVLESCP